MEEAANKIVDLSNNSEFISQLEKQQIEEYAREIALEQAKEESKQIGVDEEKIEIAKKMLEDNVDVGLISKYSGLTIDTINKLK